MYFPIGWPQLLDCKRKIHSIIANSDQSLFLLISDQTLHVWFCRPTIQIVEYERNPESIEKYGLNISAVWKSDSTQIVIRTSDDFLLFYQIIISDDNFPTIIDKK